MSNAQEVQHHDILNIPLSVGDWVAYTGPQSAKLKVGIIDAIKPLTVAIKNPRFKSKDGAREFVYIRPNDCVRINELPGLVMELIKK